MGEALIEFRQVSKAFGSLQVLDALDLKIERGVVTSVIGRSGVGKSVMLKHIMGLEKPDSGQIFLEGNDLEKMSRAERRTVKGKFSYMFQNMALFDSMTCFENIALPLEEKTKLSHKQIRAKVIEKMEQLEIQGTRGKYPAQVSGGMRKRVALARALITDPKIVLFDEPTTGLDPIRKNVVHEMIAHYQREFGFTAVVVTHDIPDVFKISQKIAMLDDGKILFEGTQAEIETCEHPRVRQFVLGLRMQHLVTAGG